MIYPSIEQAKNIAKGFDVVPVAKAIYADTQTPINIFLSIKDKNERCFLLESVNNGEKWSRYSFIGFDPVLEITAKDYLVSFKDRKGNVTEEKGNPFEILNNLMQKYKSPKVKDIPKLSGGLVGYFAYDSIRYIEKKLVNPPTDDLNMYDYNFLLCDEIIAYDHLKQMVVIVVNVPTCGDFEDNYNSSLKRIEEIEKMITDVPVASLKQRAKADFEVKSNITKEQFVQNVEKAKEYITDGDIFQIVLSQRFEIDNPPDDFEVYRILRLTNPSPYMYYFKLGDCSISGASPEMLVSVENRAVYTRPIAGTLPRGKDEKEDKDFENMLLNDPKEQAEHMMLVDLGRNDVGRVSKFGSVEVSDLMRVERYSQVMHLVTDIKGELIETKTAMDALMAVLPAGTLSGAPKVRAMELIDEMETKKRGLYGGTVGYIAFDGDMDTCIAIRTVLFKNNKAYIQAGAGIVSDSVPEKEFEESKNKAKAMLRAIEKAGGR